MYTDPLISVRKFPGYFPPAPSDTPSDNTATESSRLDPDPQS
jgi:hypothetical protein